VDAGAPGDAFEAERGVAGFRELLECGLEDRAAYARTPSARPVVDRR